MYLNKFTSSFADDETVREWVSLWAESLAGITGEQIKFGLSYCAQKHEWPPTLGEFRACCEARPKAVAALPKAGPIDRERGRAMLARVRGLIGEQRKPGKWWAEEIVAKSEAGEPVHDTALRMAREALKAPTIDLVGGQFNFPQANQV